MNKFQTNHQGATPVRLLCGLAMAVALFVHPAQARAADEDSMFEEVVVTGSRIARDPNLANVSPVTSVNQEEFVFRGTIRTEDLLNDLPSVYSAQESGQANGATGTATVDLRSLGTVRSLVLLNGRRLPPGSVVQGGYAADINQIPSALIERVDILTGGSSATYGSDAVAGVINFITHRNFEGVKLDVQRSGYRHKNDNGRVQGLLAESRTALEMANDPGAAGYANPDSTVTDGETTSASLMFGVNFEDGRGNITGYMTHRRVEPVLQGDRDFSRCTLNGRIDSCGGSGTIPNGRFTDFGGLSGNLIERPTAGCPMGSLEVTYGTTTYCALGASAVPTTGPNAGSCPDGSDEIMDGNGNVVGCAGGFAFDFIPGTGAQLGTFQRRPSSLVYNFAPDNYFQRPDETNSAGFLAHYEFAEGHEAYAEFNFNDNHTQAQIAFSGNFFSTTDLFCGNPLLSDDQRATICGQLGLTADQSFSDLTLYSLNSDRDGIAMMTMGEGDNATMSPATNNGVVFIGKRNVEGGPRSDDLRHTSFRFVAGARGEFATDWNYDFYASASEVSLEETYNNDLSVTRIIRALDVVEDANGDPVCRSVVDGSDPNCVPWNLFRGQGLVEGNDPAMGITQAALDYLRIPLFRRGTTDQRVYSGYISGDLSQYGVKFPTAENGVSAVLGLEYRDISLASNPDLGYQAGDASGQGGATLPIRGSYDVDEWFVEFDVPIIEGMNIAEELRLELAYRDSSYSTGQDTQTHKLGLSWTPISDLTLRVTSQRAVRAPNIFELFLGQGNNLTNISDPCSAEDLDRAGADAPTAEACARTGLTEAIYNNGGAPTSPAGQYNFLQGGNLDLEPEESDTLSYGVIVQPSAWPGFTATLDYFDITVEKAIGSISSQTILDRCLDNSAPVLCDSINRSRNGSLWLGLPGDGENYGHILGLQTNLGFFATTGVDYDLRYEFELPRELGSLQLINTGTYLLSWEQEEFPGAGVDECVGNWSGGCGDPTYELRNNLRATWNTPYDLAINFTWRFISGVDALDPDDTVDLGSVNYMDISATYKLPASFDAVVRAGINNVLDESPPIFGDGANVFGNGNTFPGRYDALGQYYFLGFSVQL